MYNLNIITVALIGIFLIPIIKGAFDHFSKERIQLSFVSLLDYLEFLFGILISIHLTKKIFFENSNGFFHSVYNLIPDHIRDILYGRDILTYLVTVPVILLFILLVLRLLTNPVYNYLLIPVSEAVYNTVNSMNRVLKSVISALVKLPKALFTVLIFALFLNFYSYYFSNPALAQWMQESMVYQLIYDNALQPVLNSNLAKQVPVLINDSFGKTEKGKGNGSLAERLSQSIPGANIRVIEYFNGVTLDEAIQSTPEIDKQAKKIVGKEKDSRQKAYLLYKWVSRNIKYDYDKAQEVSKDPSGISSGSIIAYSTRKGICFDFSCLYISMCKAVGVKSRLITGLGFSGVAWGDHAWNEVYDEGSKKWISVDTTFGVTGNYFDKRDFGVDHKASEIQGEW